MSVQAISDWNDHITAGHKYLKTACNGLARRSVFNDELVFQLASLVSWSVKRGLTRLQLLADRNNRPALDFYRRIGWRSTQLICLRTNELADQ